MSGLTKLPALHFYCGDLWKDNDFKSCGWQSQNLWLRMLLLLHDNVPRGEFRRKNGEPMTDEQVAKLCEMPIAEFRVLLGELESNNVFSRIAGAIANRRMLRESQLHENKVKAGKLGGSSRWQKHSKPIASMDSKPIGGLAPYSSSSSSSSSNSVKNKSIPTPDDAEWVEQLKLNPSYQHIALDLELGKMREWLNLPRNKHRKLTRQFVLNWLNKIEAPLSPPPQKRILYT